MGHSGTYRKPNLKQYFVLEVKKQKEKDPWLWVRMPGDSEGRTIYFKMP